MALRSRILQAQQCTFDVSITADYGDKLHQFSVFCQGDSQGNLTFTVNEPESIAGITGKISDTGGKLTFDDTALQFDTMADDTISPVSAPWIFLKTLFGYLSMTATRTMPCTWTSGWMKKISLKGQRSCTRESGSCHWMSKTFRFSDLLENFVHRIF